MFRADRPRIRDVDVEVVASGGDGVVEVETHEPPIEAPDNGAERRSLRALLWKRDAPEPGLDSVHAVNGHVEEVRDVDVETIEPIETPSSAEPVLFETAIAQSPAIDIAPPSERTPEAEVEIPDSVENPRSKRPRRRRAKRSKPEAASDVVPEETAEPAEPAAAEAETAETTGAASEPELDSVDALNGHVEEVRDVDVETIEPAETPRGAAPALFETAIADSPAIDVAPPSERTPGAEVELPDSIEPRSKRRRRRARAKRPRPEAASDVVPGDAVPEETAEPAEPAAAEAEPTEKTGAASIASDEVAQETSEPTTPRADEPDAGESRPAETTGAGQAEAATDSPPEVARSPTPRPTRVVWTSAAAGARQAHTLKVTKPAPSRSVPVTPPTTTPKAASQPAAPPKKAKPPAPRREPPPIVETPAEEVAPTPEPGAREQTCDILFWRGYRKAAFYGRTFDETGEAVAVAESPFFKPQGDGAPEPTEAARAAYDALRSQLLAAGWEPVSAGDEWFDETFRLTDAPEPEPE